MSFSPPVTSSTTSIGPAGDSQNKSLTNREGIFKDMEHLYSLSTQYEIFNMLNYMIHSGI